ncbi:MAG TPA: fasciclin domain-containing protein [Conexibacter sp.]|nr:fasciclin domain-containing protein [Conexibacter sp.]
MKRIALALACLAVAAIPAAGVQAATPQKNLVETAASAPQFSTLVSLVKKAGLVSTLSGRQSYTVFAPTNAAFAKVPRRTLTALANNRAKLKAVLLYHVVKGKVPASKVVRLDSARTVNGATVEIDVRKGKVYVNDARVTKPDIKASNGIVHQINRVLLPPS